MKARRWAHRPARRDNQPVPGADDDQRTRTETQLKTLQAAVPDDSDPDLLDALPIASAVFTSAPDRIKEGLLAAFDISVLYRHDLGQVTIRAALTGDTPRTTAALLDDPRTDNDTSGPAPGQLALDHSAPAPIGHSSKSENVGQSRRLAIEATIQL